jgi:hypothetical protein
MEYGDPEKRDLAFEERDIDVDECDLEVDVEDRDSDLSARSDPFKLGLCNKNCYAIRNGCAASSRDLILWYLTPNSLLNPPIHPF